jgi:TolB-like protein/DNA-binding winged helix-turn-helix (wHTH) protein/Tfp pilus assembly protein PilF
MDEPQFYEFGGFRLDARDRVLYRDSEMIVLPQKVFQTLLVLVQNAGQILEREQLMEAIWADTFVEEGNLSVNISALRKLLGADAIETIPRRGYRFTADVQRMAASPAERDLRRFDKRMAYSVGLVAIAAVAVMAFFILGRDSRPAVTSVAVMPFQNASGDETFDYLSDGLSQSLTNKLSQLSKLKVISQTSAFTYKGKDIDPQDVGRALQVETLLMGRVQLHGDDLVLNIELVSTNDKSQIWGEQYDRKLSDIIGLQSEIVREVTERLRLRIVGSDAQRLVKANTTSPEAYQAYIKGRYFAAKWTPEALRKAIDYFNQALAADPSYALAYDGLAYCYYVADFWDPWKENNLKGRAFAKKAQELDPTLSEPFVALAMIDTWADRNWPQAEDEFKHAIELNPNNAQAHLWYGVELSYLRRFDEAVAEIDRAIELDPLAADVNTGLGVVLYYAKRYDRAEEQLRKTLELQPDFWFARLHLARVYKQKGDLARAIDELEKAKKIEGASPEVTSSLGNFYAAAGRPDAARAMLNDLAKLSKEIYVPPYNYAVIYAGLGDRDNAFKYLDEEYINGSYCLNLLMVDPELDDLRFDPRFDELVMKAGFDRSGS